MASFYTHTNNKTIGSLLITIIIVFGFLNTDNVSAKASDVSIGQLAPDFTVYEVFTNKTISLTDYFGKVIILDLFATWCPPCRAALPFIYSILRSYNHSDLAIISIDIDSSESQELIKSFALEYNMIWNVTMDSDGIVSSNYGTGFVPTMYIINQTGYIQYKEIGFNYDGIVKNLDGLISPDSQAPELTGVKITPESQQMSITNNKVKISCKNVTDNYGIASVSSVVYSDSISIRKEYVLSPLSNGSINEIVEVDPLQLYRVNSLRIQLIAKDFRGNIAESSNFTFNILFSSIDEKPPDIHYINITYTQIDKYYFFEIAANITDDILVYKIEMKLQEGSKPQIYRISFKRSNNDYDSENIIWIDDLDLNIFRGKIRVLVNEITDPTKVHVTITAEDIVGNKTVTSSKTDLPENNSTSWNNFIALIAIIFILILFPRHKRDKKFI